MNDMKEEAPLGAAFLISAMMIYPYLSSIFLNTADKSITLDFTVQKKAKEKDYYQNAIKQLKQGIHFFHMIDRVKPEIYKVDLSVTEYLNKISIQRDMKSLTPYEIESIYDLFERYFAEDSEEESDTDLSNEQWQQHNQLYEALYQYVCHADFVPIRAFRDYDAIYIHQVTEQKKG